MRRMGLVRYYDEKVGLWVVEGPKKFRREYESEEEMLDHYEDDREDFFELADKRTK